MNEPKFTTTCDNAAVRMPCHCCASFGPDGYRCALARGHSEVECRALGRADDPRDVVLWKTPKPDPVSIPETFSDS